MKREVKVFIGCTLLLCGFGLMAGAVALHHNPLSPPVVDHKSIIKADIKSCSNVAKELLIPSLSTKTTIEVNLYGSSNWKSTLSRTSLLIQSCSEKFEVQSFCMGDCKDKNDHKFDGSRLVLRHK